MRISDWSSDVCSSDLSATVRDADTALQDAGKPVYKSVAMQCLPAMPFSDKGVGASLVKSIFEADSNSTISYTPSLTSLFVNGSTETGRTAIDPKTVDSNFFTTNYIGAVRSEEHTSELQTLMRIAYAVFCLKQKKHN